MFGVITLIATLAYLIAGGEDDDEAQDYLDCGCGTYPFFCFFISFCFNTSKKDSLLIIAGGQTLNFLTDKAAKQIPAELSGFVLTELKNMAKEASVDLYLLKR
jgi:hypothetical protein